MPKTIAFPSSHPGGAALSAGEQLIFELTTDSAAPVFSFKVDATLVHDATTASRTITGGKNKFTWKHPVVTAKPGEVDATDIAIIIVGDETYDYKVSKKGPGSTKTLLLQSKFAGPEVVLRDTFGVVLV